MSNCWNGCKILTVKAVKAWHTRIPGQRISWNLDSLLWPLLSHMDPDGATRIHQDQGALPEQPRRKDDKRRRLENEGQQLWWIGQGLPATFEIWLFQVLANADGHVGESKSKTCSLLNNSAAFRIWGYTSPCACAVFHSHWYRFGWPGRVLECWSN